MKRRWWVSLTVAVVGTALALVGNLAANTAKIPDSWEWTVGLFGAVVFLTVISVWVQSFQSHALRAAPDSCVDPFAELRVRIGVQWQAEIGVRWLSRPRPLRLSLQSTTRAAAAAVGRQSLAVALLPTTVDPRPAAHELVTAFVHDATRQWVIIGEKGAGKTTVALLFALAACDAAAGAPVPIVLSAAGWTPPDPEDETGERVEDWLVRRITEEYPVVGRQVMDQPGALDRIMLVLDGIDEMASHLLELALVDLDRASAGLSMVLTSRASEFESAVTAVGALSRATVLEIQPVKPADAGDYLGQRELTGSTRWQRVIDEMDRDPKGDLASALSTPLMVSLARRAYQRPADQPDELLTFHTRTEIERYLLDKFLAAVYPVDVQRRHARRWLAFLARYLERRPDDRENLRWWQLAEAVPQWVFVVIFPVLVSAIVPVLMLLLDRAWAGRFDAWRSDVVIGVFAGLSIGVLSGVRVARFQPTAQVRGGVVGATVAGTVRDLVTTVALAAGFGALLLGVAWLTDKPLAIETALDAAEWFKDLLAGQDATVRATSFLVALLVALLSVMNAMAAGRHGQPLRTAPRLRSLPGNFLGGVTLAAPVTLPVAVLFLTNDVFGMRTAIGLAAMFGWLVAIPVGVVRWFGRPIDEGKTDSPESVLRADRKAVLGGTLASGVGTVVFIVVTIWTLAAISFPDDPTGSETGTMIFVLSVLSLFPITLVPVVVFFGSGSPWLPYLVARLWLAVGRRLPWRLDSFLQSAYETGVLRKAGAAYQFRHDSLRQHLAASSPAYRRFRRFHAGPARATRPWTVVAAALMTCAAFTAVVVGIQAPYARLKGPAGRGAVDQLVFSRDGTTLAAVYDYNELTLWKAVDGTVETPPSDLAKAPHWIVNAGFVLLSGSPDCAPETAVAHEEARSPGSTFCNAWDVFSQAGDLIAVPSDERIGVWRVGGDPIDVIPIESAQRAAFSANGRVLAAVTSHSMVLADLTTHDYRHAEIDWIHTIGIAISGDGRTVADVNALGDVELRRWQQLDAVDRLSAGNGLSYKAGARSNVQSLAFSSDSRRLATVGEDGVVAIWDLTSNKIECTVDVSSNTTSVAFSPDGRMIAVGNKNGDVILTPLPPIAE